MMKSPVIFLFVRLLTKLLYKKESIYKKNSSQLYFFDPEKHFFKKKAGRHPSFLSNILIPAGFEPATVRLEGECSIQLSYETQCIYSIKKKIGSQSSIYDKEIPAES